MGLKNENAKRVTLNWSLGTTTFKMIRKVYTINTDNKLALAVCHYNCYACTRHYLGITVLPRRALCILVVTTETCWGKVWVQMAIWLRNKALFRLILKPFIKES